MNNSFTGENPLHDTLNWRKRFLPHYDGSGKYQSITFRLNDALPSKVLQRLNTVEDSLEKILKTENELDFGYGSCLLRYPSIAQLMQNVLKYFDGERYSLTAWVIMPNHIHVLIKTYENYPLGKVVHSWKSYSSLKIANKCSELDVEAINPIWQREYWDRFIRDENHFQKVVAYIHDNPVKAGLVKCVENFRWSSCFKRD